MTGLIERLPELEAKLGVTVDALYAYSDGKYIHINGELKAAPGRTFPEGLKLAASFFDASGRMLETAEHWVDDEYATDLEPFSLLANLDDDEDKVVRIRILVRRG